MHIDSPLCSHAHACAQFTADALALSRDLCVHHALGAACRVKWVEHGPTAPSPLPHSNPLRTIRAYETARQWLTLATVAHSATATTVAMGKYWLHSVIHAIDLRHNCIIMLTASRRAGHTSSIDVRRARYLLKLPVQQVSCDETRERQR